MSKIIRNFAPNNILEGGLVRLLVAGFFYACAMHIYGVTPVGNCNRTPALEVLFNGSVTPFFFVTTNIYLEMNNTKNNVRGTKKSNAVCTPIGAKSEPTKFSVSEKTANFAECISVMTTLELELKNALTAYFNGNSQSAKSAFNTDFYDDMEHVKARIFLYINNAIEQNLKKDTGQI